MGDQPEMTPTTTAAQPLATVWDGLTASSRAEVEAKWPRLHDAIEAAVRQRRTLPDEFRPEFTDAD